jgi:hypothetical protein
VLAYLDMALPLSNMDAGAAVADEYIHSNIPLVETEAFNDQFDNFDFG